MLESLPKLRFLSKGRQSSNTTNKSISVLGNRETQSNPNFQ